MYYSRFLPLALSKQHCSVLTAIPSDRAHHNRTPTDFHAAWPLAVPACCPTVQRAVLWADYHGAKAQWCSQGKMKAVLRWWGYACYSPPRHLHRNIPADIQPQLHLHQLPPYRQEPAGQITHTPYQHTLHGRERRENRVGKRHVIMTL